jgi:hypothetical protein
VRRCRVWRVWGLMPRLGTPLECPDVPRGETPKRTPNPMILGIEALIPHQRANTPDPSIENPWRGEGSSQKREPGFRDPSQSPMNKRKIYYYRDRYDNLWGQAGCQSS